MKLFFQILIMNIKAVLSNLVINYIVKLSITINIHVKFPSVSVFRVCVTTRPVAAIHKN